MTTPQFEIIKNGGSHIDLTILERILERHGIEPTDELLKDLLSFHFDPENEIRDYQLNVLHQEEGA